MLISLALGVTCNDPYVRTRADNTTCTTPTSSAHCLWWPGQSTVTFHQSTTGNPASTPSDPTNAAVFAAITRSWQTWQGIMNDCGSLTITEGDKVGSDQPGSPGRTVGYDQSSPNSNINIVLFRQRTCDFVPSSDPCHTSSTCGNQYDCWEHSASTIALTTTTYDRNTGKILDADIELNGQAPGGTTGFKFTLVDMPPCPMSVTSYNCVAADIQNTATHEFGHSLGLDHTMYPIFDPCIPGCTSMNYTHSTMYAQAPTGDLCKRCVDSGSRKFVCDVYPKNQAAKDCVGNGTTGSSSSSGCSAAPGGPMLALALLALRTARRRRGRRIT
jgi:Synergist-CTERM protein sorting domain-containing protein